MEKHYTKKYTKVSGNRYSNNLAYLKGTLSIWSYIWNQIDRVTI